MPPAPCAKAFVPHSMDCGMGEMVTCWAERAKGRRAIRRERRKDLLFIIWMFDGFVSCAAGSGRCVPCKGSSNSENRKGVGGFLLIFSGGGGGLERIREDWERIGENWGG